MSESGSHPMNGTAWRESCSGARGPARMVGLGRLLIWPHPRDRPSRSTLSSSRPPQRIVRAQSSTTVRRPGWRCRGRGRRRGRTSPGFQEPRRPSCPRPRPARASTPTVTAESPSPSPTPTETPVPVTSAPPTGAPPVPCGTYDPACARMPVSGVGGVPFTPDVACGSLGQCTLKLDVLFPRAAGPWPVVVAVPGGPAAPGIRSGLGEFAQLVAGQGAVVFVADYRESPEWGGGSPTTYQDIACAIRFARAHAAEYGGDGRRVTLVAHSLGPFFATTAALSADPFEPAPGTCLTTAGATKPDAFIGIAGIYSQAGVTSGFLDSFFGGSQTAAPAAWAAGDPFAVIRQAGAHRIPVRLIHGELDGNVQPQSSQDFEQALEAAGFDSSAHRDPAGGSQQRPPAPRHDPNRARNGARVALVCWPSTVRGAGASVRSRTVERGRPRGDTEAQDWHRPAGLRAADLGGDAPGDSP